VLSPEPDAPPPLASDLTTNLPRFIMGFSDYPFTRASTAGRSADGRQFPGRAEV
jgi:hypothetical protein